MSEYLEFHALADGQLEGDDKSRVAEQILSDPSARAEYETVQILKQTVKRAYPPIPEPEVWQVCRGRLDAIDRSKKAEVFIGRHAWAICGLFIMLIISAAMFNRMTGRNRLYPADLGTMMSSMSPLPFGEPSSAQQAMDARLGGSPVHIPTTGLRPTRMMQGFVQGRNAIVVEFADRFGSANLIVIENIHEVEGLRQDGAQLAYSVGKLNDMNAVSWQSDGFICIIVGDRDVADLCAAASQIRIVR